MLNIALPKGRLGNKIYDMLLASGFATETQEEGDRKLIMRDEEAGISYFWVKPSDVATYVECGAADVGIVGKDLLLEQNPEVYELLDLKTGICRLAVAAPKDFRDDSRRQLKVGTSYTNVARRYYESIGRDVAIIPLHGSVELAPLTGLSDVIVDIVETGRTLKENGLEVVTEIVPISARFIANKAHYEFKRMEIQNMLDCLKEQVAAKEEK